MRGAIPLLTHMLSWRVTLPLLVSVPVITSTQARFTAHCFSRLPSNLILSFTVTHRNIS